MLVCAENESQDEKRNINRVGTDGRSIIKLLENLDYWRANSEKDMGKIPLPPEFYSSKDILKIEVEKIFKKEWLCVGHISELNRTGDYLTFDLVRAASAALAHFLRSTISPCCA